MANYCYYFMKVTGQTESVKEFVDIMTGQTPEGIIGRTYSADDYEYETFSSNITSCFLTGDCAWSVHTAMIDLGDDERNLVSESKRLDLAIEVFSEETGMGFQEHYLIVKGKMIIDEEEAFESIYIGDYESLEAYNEENETNYTEDMVTDEEYVNLYGFDNYGIFEDHLNYILPNSNEVSAEFLAEELSHG